MVRWWNLLMITPGQRHREWWGWRHGRWWHGATTGVTDAVNQRNPNMEPLEDDVPLSIGSCFWIPYLFSGERIHLIDRMMQKHWPVLGFSISSLYWISSWLGCVAMRFWDLRFWHQKKRFVGCPCASYRVCWFASRVSRSKWRCGVILGRLEEAGNQTSKGPKPSRSRYM